MMEPSNPVMEINPTSYHVSDAENNFGSTNPHMPAPAMTYNDVFPGLPETVGGAQPDRSIIGKWNNKLRVGSRNVTQVSLTRITINLMR